MTLTDIAARSAKPDLKPRKLADGKGLFLLVHPSGAKYWRLKYRYGGKEKLLSLGVYPDVSLAEARRCREEARKLLADGIDPSAHRKAVRAARVAVAVNSLEIVSREWHSKHSPNWAKSHALRVIRRLENDIFPWLG
jgi:hypothetical protein